MILKKFTLAFLPFIFFAVNIGASVWQWSVKTSYLSDETNNNSEAFLWIPENCDEVKGVVFGQHNMCEETIFEHPAFRKAMSELDFAIIWVTPIINFPWDVTTGCQDVFDKLIVDLAEKSGYRELSKVPIVPLGHSAMATFPWNFSAWNPEKTLAVISYKGDAPRTNLTGYGGSNLEWGRTRNIDGIPGLMIEGEFEWWEARVNPALAFRMMYPESCISFLCDAGNGHFDVSDQVVEYISLFIKKSVQYRLNDDGTLNKIDCKKGWLAERWSNNKKRSKAAPFAKYKGDPHDAFWYFDGEIAEATEQYYAEQKNKKMQYISFTHNGMLLPFQKKAHVQYNLPFKPGKDGITFYLGTAFTDSLHLNISNEHAPVKTKVNRINGPVKKINDSTFQIQFYRMGFENKKRTNEITLVAHNPGDKNYKSAVQEISVKFPYPNMDGVMQSISFGSLPDVDFRSKSIKLNAASDSNLPVSYYVKEGPAVIDGDILTIQKIPPKAKYPVKVTVVAWQYGIIGKVQTAKPVERHFYITQTQY